jgi:hypothetical protein
MNATLIPPDGKKYSLGKIGTYLSCSLDGNNLARFDVVVDGKPETHTLDASAKVQADGGDVCIVNYGPSPIRLSSGDEAPAARPAVSTPLARPSEPGAPSLSYGYAGAGAAAAPARAPMTARASGPVRSFGLTRSLAIPSAMPPGGVTHGDRVNFVRRIEVPPAPPVLSHVRALVEGSDGPKDDVKQGFVVGGGAAAFTPGFKATEKNDVLNSMVLAQLAANKVADRENQTEAWYAKYREVMENIGWAIQNFQFSEFNAAASDFSADQVILQVMSAIGTGDEIAAGVAVINALKSLSDGDGRLVLFDTNSHEAHNGNFQVTVATKDENQNTVVKMGAFFFKSTDTVTRFLWFKFNSVSTHFWQAGEAITLDTDIYAAVRATIVEKLGVNAQNYVKNLSI